VVAVGDDGARTGDQVLAAQFVLRLAGVDGAPGRLIDGAPPAGGRRDATLPEKVLGAEVVGARRRLGRLRGLRDLRGLWGLWSRRGLRGLRRSLGGLLLRVPRRLVERGRVPGLVLLRLLRGVPVSRDELPGVGVDRLVLLLRGRVRVVCLRLA